MRMQRGQLAYHQRYVTEQGVHVMAPSRTSDYRRKTQGDHSGNKNSPPPQLKQPPPRPPGPPAPYILPSLGSLSLGVLGLPPKPNAETGTEVDKLYWDTSKHGERSDE
jgi:hypothetical protein